MYGSLATKLAVLQGLRELGFRAYYVRENHRCQKEKGVPCFEVGLVNTAAAAVEVSAGGTDAVQQHDEHGACNDEVRDPFETTNHTAPHLVFIGQRSYLSYPVSRKLKLT